MHDAQARTTLRRSHLEEVGLRYVKLAVFVSMVLLAFWIVIVGGRVPAAVGDDVVIIQYWEKWTGDEGQKMKDVVDAFNATVGKEKKIYVRYVSMSQVDQKTLVATAAGVPPDVAGIWDAQLDQFAAMNALLPLDDLAARHGITPSHYKPIYWQSCMHDGKLVALISTPASIALHWNKQAFADHADELRARGLDPDRPPRTIKELDEYADALTTFETVGGKQRIKVSGHLPLEPGWYIAVMPGWFGGAVFDEKTRQLQLTSPAVVETYEWIAGYSKRYGKDSVSEFRSGLGQFGSAQNPFLVESVSMEQQGPWMARVIEENAPHLNRWHMPAEALARERQIEELRVGMSRADVIERLSAPMATSGDGKTLQWDAGLRVITASFEGGRIRSFSADLLPAVERRKYAQWGVAPFPSNVPGVTNVAFCAFDALVIPRGSKHPEEAFEFIAYVNRQEVMERLCASHCKNSPLADVSQHFIDYHPNPYIQVFEDLANSPNAFSLPSIAIWPEVADELSVASQKTYLLAGSPMEILRDSQARLHEKWQTFQDVQRARAQP